MIQGAVTAIDDREHTPLCPILLIQSPTLHASSVYQLRRIRHGRGGSDTLADLHGLRSLPGIGSSGLQQSSGRLTAFTGSISASFQCSPRMKKAPYERSVRNRVAGNAQSCRQVHNIRYGSKIVKLQGANSNADGGQVRVRVRVSIVDTEQIALHQADPKYSSEVSDFSFRHEQFRHRCRKMSDQKSGYRKSRPNIRRARTCVLVMRAWHSHTPATPAIRTVQSKCRYASPQLPLPYLFPPLRVLWSGTFLWTGLGDWACWACTTSMPRRRNECKQPVRT